MVEHVLGKSESCLGELVYDDLVARGRSIYTARQWRSKVNEFEACCGYKSAYDREDVLKFLLKLREAGWRQSSIETMLRSLKLLAQIQQWPDGFPQLAMRKVRDEEVSRPMFSHDEVIELIRRGKQIFSRRELSALALSTIYGLRRGEICTAEVGSGKVKISTAKGGRVVEHLVPFEIKPFIEGHKHSDVYYMTNLFHRMIEKIGVSLPLSFGWHSIRRALVTELVIQEVSLLNIVRFMRWSDASLKGQFNMVAIYAARDQEQVDRNVFMVHPFLSAWRNEVRGEQSSSAGTCPLTSGEVVPRMDTPGGDKQVSPPLLDTFEKSCSQNLGYRRI